ncbi:hypothetical protein LSTR_LSTR004701 [Laodelphax striatellus]|uniref:Uncharacterized protein n=1 Tax=Laodelphax striatellus TaxID=195883 RepID=A0A482WU46_LAOST|nr:hypothetical protein LSTR_LSTR004701 [Laodelphax striatellus]
MDNKVNTGNQELDDKICEWMSWNRNEKFRNEATTLIEEGNVKILEKLFLKRLSFGTAGIRGRMGPGYAQMNDLVIIQTSQGLLKWIQGKTDHDSHPKVIIGYDGRHNSLRFAQLVASVFLNGGCKVWLFSKTVPTPFVSFGTALLGDLGIMITASHNPKEDNGYKVYWKQGVQINSPFDKEIEKCIQECLLPLNKSWDISTSQNYRECLLDPLKEVQEAYHSKLWDGPFDPDSSIEITYTAMHGVGYPYIVGAFEYAKLKPVIPVEEQILPDPEFPTVKFPNPEEGKSCLNLSIETANRHGSNIILANDPDADRLAVAEKSVDGHWKILNGNEIGALLGWWCFTVEKLRLGKDFDPSKLYFLSSAVSSKILKTMSQAEGFNFEETLTGFKWLGKRSLDLSKENESNKVLFAFEEAIGFMCGDVVLDKDGISAAVCIAKLATWLKKQGLTLQDQLKIIYDTYGKHLTNNSYLICEDPAVIRNIFHRLNHFTGSPKTYPESILNGKYTLKDIRDLVLGYDTTRKQHDYKPNLPLSSSSPMITFTFTNGLVATLRASGTEPKLKYYTELCAHPDEKDVAALLNTQTEMIEAIMKEFLQPEQNGLKYRNC